MRQIIQMADFLNPILISKQFAPFFREHGKLWHFQTRRLFLTLLTFHTSPGKMQHVQTFVYDSNTKKKV